ncbi:hypothetical protein VP01_894g3 [Puccinia sorghi]|uniref:Uncharacterized protein n=1 Tax=Puccinia sorghi TaxID=27349 RepID=A0A0L6U818_9BASI|nr:hypothetical protein VP01_894g3 [Puccinia sorghi]
MSHSSPNPGKHPHCEQENLKNLFFLCFFSCSSDFFLVVTVVASCARHTPNKMMLQGYVGAGFIVLFWQREKCTSKICVGTISLSNVQFWLRRSAGSDCTLLTSHAKKKKKRASHLPASWPDHAVTRVVLLPGCVSHMSRQHLNSIQEYISHLINSRQSSQFFFFVSCSEDRGRRGKSVYYRPWGCEIFFVHGLCKPIHVIYLPLAAREPYLLRLGGHSHKLDQMLDKAAWPSLNSAWPSFNWGAGKSSTLPKPCKCTMTAKLALTLVRLQITKCYKAEKMKHEDFFFFINKVHCKQNLLTACMTVQKHLHIQTGGVWMTAWLEHVACHLQAVEQIFYAGYMFILEAWLSPRNKKRKQTKLTVFWDETLISPAEIEDVPISLPCPSSQIKPPVWKEKLVRILAFISAHMLVLISIFETFQS